MTNQFNGNSKHVNDRHPNFYKHGQFYLVRCFHCDPEYGKENYILNVSAGICTWCGWSEDPQTLKIIKGDMHGEETKRIKKDEVKRAKQRRGAAKDYADE